MVYFDSSKRYGWRQMGIIQKQKIIMNRINFEKNVENHLKKLVKKNKSKWRLCYISCKLPITRRPLIKINLIHLCSLIYLLACSTYITKLIIFFTIEIKPDRSSFESWLFATKCCSSLLIKFPMVTMGHMLSMYHVHYVIHMLQTQPIPKPVIHS